MRQHHTKVHGDPLPNRTCEGCGTEFYDEKARLKYCDDCDPNAGEHNGNWKDAQETAECQRCGSEFEYYPSDKYGVYCPECVEAADDFLGTPYADTIEVETIERTCDHCGADMEVLASERQYGNGRFCCQECLWSWMSENRRGSDHPQWTGAASKYYGSWNSARKRTLERDDYECQNCGKGRAALGRNPDVHHIVPVREFDDPVNAHFIENLVSLCPQCHAKAENGDITVTEQSSGKDNSIK